MPSPILSLAVHLKIASLVLSWISIDNLTQVIYADGAMHWAFNPIQNPTLSEIENPIYRSFCWLPMNLILWINIRYAS